MYDCYAKAMFMKKWQNFFSFSPLCPPPIIYIKLEIASCLSVINVSESILMKRPSLAS